MGSLLLHVCCAHCAAYPVNHWRSQGHEVAALWYNPNIHPFQEYVQRLGAVRSLAESQQFPLIVSETYDSVRYFQAVRKGKPPRCRHCFSLRLARTARIAGENRFDAFTTTLLISHQQKHGLVKEAGLLAGESAGVRFVYQDLRKRYSDSRHITKPMAIYRQEYCGCCFSEMERYTGEELE